jgi:hypothetical protein
MEGGGDRCGDSDVSNRGGVGACALAATVVGRPTAVMMANTLREIARYDYFPMY